MGRRAWPVGRIGGNTVFHVPDVRGPFHAPNMIRAMIFVRASDVSLTICSGDVEDFFTHTHDSAFFAHLM